VQLDADWNNTLVPHLPSPFPHAGSPLPGSEQLTLETSDGERLAAVHVPRPASAGVAAGSRAVAIVVAHGFTGSIERPALRAVARGLSPYAGLLLFDFRGHGGSTGVSTLGDLEVLDVQAAVAAARALGYRDVVTCGWSMGSSVVLRHAGLTGGVDAVIAISGPSRWYVRDSIPMRKLMWLVETKPGRAVARRAYNLRIGDAWTKAPESPVEVVGKIAPTPLLVVHGRDDHYFGVDHAQSLYAAAGQPSELWLVDGFGHAENGADAGLLDRIGRHVEVMLGGDQAAAGTGS
jgi:pimeloyl-ACP methyl ester carboxylesterase